MSTKIEWVQSLDGKPGETWNPIVGCSHVSPGCNNCYAEKMAWRLKCMGCAQYKSVVTNKGWTGKTFLAEKQLGKPQLRKRPTTFFVCSMSDLFHEDVPPHWVNNVFGVMRDLPKNTFILLSKRAKRMQHYLNNWVNIYGGALPNVWANVTTENQRMADKRIPLLLRTPAAIRGVSVEPMLEPVDLDRYFYGWCPHCGSDFGCTYENKCLGCSKRIAQSYLTAYDESAPTDDPDELWIPPINWVIIGAESGPKRRPCSLEWVRDLVGQCKRANVPVFVKQLDIEGKLSKNMSEWPPDLRIRQMPRRERKV
jgi:protein gp37